MLKISLTILLLGYLQIIIGQSEQKDIVIGKSFDFDSRYLKHSISIFVTKPDDFNQKSYPMAVLLGAEENDFRASILKNTFITVGIQTNDFKKDFLKEEDRIVYLKFILNELVPFVKSQYNTSDVKLITGHSFAGAMVIESFLKHPDSFTFYLATSPVLQSVRKNQLDSLQPGQGRLLYFAIGRNENYPELEQANHDFHFRLDSLQINQLNWKFEVLKDETHQTNAFTGFCKGYSYYQSFAAIPDSILSCNLDSIDNYIDKVREQMGLSIDLDENVLMSHLLLNLSNKSYATVTETTKYIAENKPDLIRDELNVMLEIAKQLRIRGGREMAYYTFQYIYEITNSDVALKNMEELKQGY